jgi:hypothetical protein
METCLTSFVGSLIGGTDPHARFNPLSLDYAWLPFCRLAFMDVASIDEGRPLSGALAVQPRAYSTAAISVYY